MRKIILGTDLHNKPSELAAKLVRDLKKDSIILSIQNKKEIVREENVIVIPRVFKNNMLRKIVQAISLPFHLYKLRKTKEIYTFWTAQGKYYNFLFWFMKKLGYDIHYTVISGYDKEYGNLKYCDTIICQSEKMKNFIDSKFPGKRLKVIYPWVDLKVFKPGKKEFDLVIPSVPYKISDFPERGIDKLIKIIGEYRTVVIFRSNESYEYFRKLATGAKLINKILEDNELAEIVGECKVMPLIYGENAPDMPLSAVEGLGCGCNLVCTKNLGISEIEGVIGVNPDSDVPQIKKAIDKALKLKSDSRKIAEKLFSKKNVLRY